MPSPGLILLSFNFFQTFNTTRAPALPITNHSKEDRLVVLLKIIALETCSREKEYQRLLESVAKNSYLGAIFNVALIMEKVGEMMEWFQTLKIQDL